VVQLVGDGRVFGASSLWCQAGPLTSRVTVKPYEEALAEARRQLVNADAYELGDWSWGYKELVDDLGQEQMSLVYEFAFVPRKKLEPKDHPPQLVEVPAKDAA
jgi:hypothetical protein